MCKIALRAVIVFVKLPLVTKLSRRGTVANDNSSILSCELCRNTFCREIGGCTKGAAVQKALVGRW